MSGHPGMGLYHVSCPYTGKAHCYCPHGASSAQQQASMASNAKHMLDRWREAAGALPSPSRPPQAPPLSSGAGPSSEMLLPRMYRNPQSMDLGNDTPVYIRDEPITRNQALARLDDCTLEARKLATEAVQLALYAGIDYHPPPEVGVDPANFPVPSDLKALKEIASGVVVAATKAGKLTPAEEQQLLGLTDEEYHSLSSIRAAAAQPGPSSHGGGREVDGSNANGKPGKPNLLKLKDIKPNLKGQEVLIQTPTDDTSWHRSRILEVSVKNRTASMSFPGITQTVTINLGDTIREKRLAWVDSPPVAESSPKTVAPQQGGGLQTQMAWQQQQQQQQQRMGLPERAGANPQMAHQMALQRQMEQQDRNLLGNGGDRANAQRSATMYGYGLQPQLPPQQPPRGPSPQMPRSVVEAIISFGHKAEGVKVEVTLISSGQRRTGVVVRSCPSPKYISVDFGHVQANLKAQDEFSMYSLRILE